MASKSKSKKGKTVAEKKPAAEQPAEQAASQSAAQPQQPRTIGLGVRLVPAGDSDQPRVTNYTSLTLAPGMAFIDFGFFEPAMLAALPRVAQQGGKLPEAINGRLATRVAMSYETLNNLHQQLASALQGLKKT
ncbi:MAG TPA: hypothetical protein VL199_14120 [Burkholderiales bacterium]|jgi:hypothetical protein|nr:hypothetical protein [Burkholderiales bacterium]